MFGLFYRSSCHSRLVFNVSKQHINQQQQQQQCFSTTSFLLTPTIAATTTKQRRKRKPVLLTKPTPPAHSLAISPPLTKAPKHRKVSHSQPLVFQQCAGLRSRDGKPCQRQIPVDPKHVSPTTLAYCHDHRPLVTTTSNATNTANAHSPSPESSPPNLSSHLNDTTTVPTTPTTPTPTNTIPVMAPPYLTSSSMESERSIESFPIVDCWSLWIGKHIKPRKRMQIQQEMIKPISPKDEAGYLYAYHLTQGPRVSTHHYCYFKIGRSINPTRRVAQVFRKCNYQPKLLDIIPGKPRITKQQRQQQQQQQQLQQEVLMGDIGRMLKCPISHRVERLIHLELGAMYPITGGFKCQGCGTTHREWFRVKRPLVQVMEDDSGHSGDGDDGGGKEQWRRMTDQEVWMTKIRPVMLHWIQYGVAASALRQALSTPSSSSSDSLDPPLC